MTLFEECLMALGKDVIQLSEKETTKVFESMLKLFPINFWGKIEWKKINHKIQILSINEITKHININDNEIYILWDEMSLPSIKTNINNVLNVIEDVTAVSFDTWIYCPSEGYVIEFYHENEITIGWKN